MLCRACGGEMHATEHCTSCNEGIQWKCSSCNKENDKSIHTYHPSAGEIFASIHSSLVGALACLATGLTFFI